MPLPSEAPKVGPPALGNARIHVEAEGLVAIDVVPGAPLSRDPYYLMTKKLNKNRVKQGLHAGLTFDPLQQVALVGISRANR